MKKILILLSLFCVQLTYVHAQNTPLTMEEVLQLALEAEQKNGVAEGERVRV